MSVAYRLTLLFILLVLCLFPSRQGTEKTKKLKAVEKGIAWLDKIDANPFRLQEKGLKGKKIFMEKLYAYYQIYKHERHPDKKRELYQKMAKMLDCTNDPRYHRLPSDDKGFKEDISTYLHICLVMEKIGLDTSLYRKRITHYLPRIYQHIKLRNTTSQMLFVEYLYDLGYPTRISLDDLVSLSKTAEMREVKRYKIDDVRLIAYMYDICHEVFVFTNHGEKEPAILKDEHKNYLLTTIPLLIKWILKEGDWRHIDVLAELVICLSYMGRPEDPLFAKGINHILASQNDAGFFESFEHLSRIYKQKGIQYKDKGTNNIHTTEVCLWALAIAKARE